MEKLIVVETDKHRFAVRPIHWAGEFHMSIHGGTISSLIKDNENHYAVFWKKEDAEFFVKCKEAEHQLEEKVVTMGRLPDETLDNALDVLKHCIACVEASGSEEYPLALDKVTVSFLEELKQYRYDEAKRKLAALEDING